MAFGDDVMSASHDGVLGVGLGPSGRGCGWPSLDGVCIVDFGQYLTDPLLAMMLSDLGAHVIRGDPPRWPALGPRRQRKTAARESAMRAVLRRHRAIVGGSPAAEGHCRRRPDRPRSGARKLPDGIESFGRPYAARMQQNSSSGAAANDKRPHA